MNLINPGSIIRIRNTERSTFNELAVLFLKLIVYGVLLFIHQKYPEVYAKAPLLGQSLMVFIGASLIVSVIRLILVTWYIRKNRLNSNIKDNFILGINSIVSVLNTVLLVLAFMVFIGIDPKEFLTSITIVAAAIALTFKDYITNMINGLIIMFSDRLSLGDYIKVLDQEGRILDITLVNIVLQNQDNDMVLIPNSLVFSVMIVNQSKQNVRKLTVDFELDLLHGHTPSSLEDYFLQVLAPYTEQLVNDGFSVKTVEIRKDLARFKIQVLLKIRDRQKEREIKRMLNTAVLQLTAQKR
ncbi:MAG: mechanosensitive ion channel [Chitinophagaceae bacterium]|nr:mechanosensitive ion channel [Chitinophagaceae bacterium]